MSGNNKNNNNNIETMQEMFPDAVVEGSKLIFTSLYGEDIEALAGLPFLYIYTETELNMGLAQSHLVVVMEGSEPPQDVDTPDVIEEEEYYCSISHETLKGKGKVIEISPCYCYIDNRSWVVVEKDVPFKQ